MTFGLPYLGSKSKFAAELVAMLPAAANFYDLFAGGCAVTQAAAMTKKYKTVYASDITTSANLFYKAIHGRINLNVYLHNMSREAFHFYKKIDLLAAIIFSFHSNLKDYLYGDGRTSERWQHLERLQRIEELKNFSWLNVRTAQASYDKVKILPDSVIYCDIPYNETRGYLNKFNQEKFLDWARTSTQPIFISSYNLPAPWVSVWERPRLESLNHEAHTVIEKLFTLPKFAGLVPRQLSMF